MILVNSIMLYLLVYSLLCNRLYFFKQILSSKRVRIYNSFALEHLQFALNLINKNVRVNCIFLGGMQRLIYSYFQSFIVLSKKNVHYGSFNSNK